MIVNFLNATVPPPSADLQINFCCMKVFGLGQCSIALCAPQESTYAPNGAIKFNELRDECICICGFCKAYSYPSKLILILQLLY